MKPQTKRAALLFSAAQTKQHSHAAAHTTRTLSPKLGFLGLFAFAESED